MVVLFDNVFGCDVSSSLSSFVSHKELFFDKSWMGVKKNADADQSDILK